MTNFDPHKTESAPSRTPANSSHYANETIIGIKEKELETAAQTLIPSQQDLRNELPGTSLRPKILQDGFELDSSSVGERRILPPDEADLETGHVDYQTLKLLGEGGMGQVHLARQIALGRNVAVKQIRPSLKQQADQQEFLTEAVVTGKLEHPNIVPIYEVGQTAQGDLFYSMKNVQGQPWSEMMDEMSLMENLETLLDVCDAIAFAHSQGVIHRDLKPVNIMIGGFGEVLVMDWGLAMIPGESSTMSTAIAGTPAYMSPEMVNAPEQAETRSDVYLLGGILFRMLSGQSPHTGKSARESLVSTSRNEITVCPPQRLEDLDPSGELLEISLQSMKADPSDRFASVEQFQDSLRGFLLHRDSLELSARAEQALTKAKSNGDYAEYSRAVFGFEEAIKLWNENSDAREGSHTARLEWAHCAEQQGDFDLSLSLLDELDSDQTEIKARLQTSKQERDSRQTRLKRLKTIGLAASLIVASLATGAAIWIDSERDKALTAQQKEATERARANIAAAEAKKEASRADRQAKIAKAAQLRATQEAALARKEKSRADAEAADAKASRIKAEENLAIAERNGYAADMLLVASAWERVQLPRLHDLLDRYTDRGDLKGIGWSYFKRQTDPSLSSIYVGNAIFNFAISPDGKLISTANKHHHILFYQTTDLQKKARRIIFKDSGGDFYSSCFSPDGRLHAVGTRNGHIVLTDVSGMKVKRSWLAHQGNTYGVHFTPDSKQVWTAGKDALVKLWDVETGKELQVLKGHRSPVQMIDLNPDGTQMVTGCLDGGVHIWDLESSKKRRSLQGIPGDVRTLAWHPSEPFVAGGGVRGPEVFVWDVRSGELKYPPLLDQSMVTAVAFSPDGRYLAYGGYHDLVRIIDFESGNEIQAFRGHLYSIKSLSFDPLSRRLFSLSGDKWIRSWDCQSSTDRLELQGHTGRVTTLVTSPDQKYLISAGIDGLVTVRDFESAQMVARWKAHDAGIYGMACTSGGQLVSVGVDQQVKLWDLSGRLLRSAQTHVKGIYGIALLPDEQRFLLSDYRGVVKLYELSTLQELRSYQTDDSYGHRVVLTSDGKEFITGHKMALLKRWDLETGQLLEEYPGNDTAGDITGITISSDDRYIAAGGMDSTVRVWERESGELVHQLYGHSFAVRSLDFTSDSLALASAGMDGDVKIWTMASGQEELVLKEPDMAFSVLFHLDDDRIVTGGDRGAIHLWDMRSWTEKQRVQARARSVLKYYRERMTSLEEMVSELETDETIGEETKRQATEWAELFWNGQFPELLAEANRAFEVKDIDRALEIVDHLHLSQSQSFLDNVQLAETFVKLQSHVHQDLRPELLKDARECLVRALELASFDDLRWLVYRLPVYGRFRYDREFLELRLQATGRLKDELPDDSLRIRHHAYSHYDLGHWHKANDQYSKAIEYFTKAEQLHAERIPFTPEDPIPHTGVTLCKNYRGICHLELCHYDQAMEIFGELVTYCDDLIEKEIGKATFEARRKIYESNQGAAKIRQMKVGDLAEFEFTSKNALMLIGRATEFAKVGRYADSQSAIERYLELDLENQRYQQEKAGEAYAECADMMLSPVEHSQPLKDPALPEEFFKRAETCFQKAVKLGWTCNDSDRNSSELKSLLEREGFAQMIGLEIVPGMPEDRSEWRTAQTWIDDPDKKTYSHFRRLPNGDWLEEGINADGNSFETRFELHRETPLLIELNKEGVNVRVRLWSDKAFWGRISSASNEVTTWNLLQTGSWIESQHQAPEDSKKSEVASHKSPAR